MVFKAIAMGLVCLFTWNNIAWANPDGLSLLRRNTLSRWYLSANPNDRPSYEATLGIKYLAEGEPELLDARLRLVNRILVQTASVPGTDPAVEFVSASQDGERTKATFRVLSSNVTHEIFSGPDGISCPGLWKSEKSNVFPTSKSDSADAGVGAGAVADTLGEGQAQPDESNQDRGHARDIASTKAAAEEFFFATYKLYKRIKEEDPSRWAELLYGSPFEESVQWKAVRVKVQKLRRKLAGNAAEAIAYRIEHNCVNAIGNLYQAVGLVGTGIGDQLKQLKKDLGRAEQFLTTFGYLILKDQLMDLDSYNEGNSIKEETMQKAAAEGYTPERVARELTDLRHRELDGMDHATDKNEAADIPSSGFKTFILNGKPVEKEAMAMMIQHLKANYFIFNVGVQGEEIKLGMPDVDAILDGRGKAGAHVDLDPGPEIGVIRGSAVGGELALTANAPTDDYRLKFALDVTRFARFLIECSLDPKSITVNNATKVSFEDCAGLSADTNITVGNSIGDIAHFEFSQAKQGPPPSHLPKSSSAGEDEAGAEGPNRREALSKPATEGGEARRRVEGESQETEIGNHTLFMVCIEDSGSRERPEADELQKIISEFNLDRLRGAMRMPELTWQDAVKFAQMANKSWEQLESSRRLIIDHEKQILEVTFIKVVSQMREVNNIDRALNKTVAADGKPVYYIVMQSAMLKEQRVWATELNKIETASNEHLVIVDDTDRHPSTAERINRLKLEMVEILSDEESPDGVIFNIAVSDDVYDGIKGDNVNKVSFQGETQLEAILVALRAYERGGEVGRNALLELYRILKGKPYAGKLPDINDRASFEAFARSLILNLPKAAAVPTQKINRILLSFIRSA